jgi:Uma2 family endonuclease
MEPVKKCASYADLCELPERFIAEIVEGDLYATPRPGFPVGLATSVLLGTLGSFHHRGLDGWILLHKIEVHFGDDVLVPDLAGWRRERLPAMQATDYMTLAPDWVCEVLSPITEPLDRGKKLQRYLREGVAHVWFVDPAWRTLEVLALAGTRWVLQGHYEGEALVRAAPFDSLEMDLGRLWGWPRS